MPPITALSRLLAEMSPRLGPDPLVFCVVPFDRAGEWLLESQATVVEEEGVTLVMPQRVADAAALPYEGVFRRITLSVHSSLEAVGFLAAVASALADQRIPANAFAGSHHDHVLVPAARAEDAMRVLADLQALWRERTSGRDPG